MSQLALMAASDRSNSRCGGFLYSAFAEAFCAFRGIDFATRLRWLFDLLKPRAVAGWANNLRQHFTRWLTYRSQSQGELDRALDRRRKLQVQLEGTGAQGPARGRRRKQAEEKLAEIQTPDMSLHCANRRDVPQAELKRHAIPSTN